MNASSNDKPWIRYNLLSRSILEITMGDKPEVGQGEGCVETTIDVAISFINGTLNLQQFVIPSDGEPTVASRVDFMVIKTCWMLDDVGSSTSPIELSSVYSDGIVVRSRIKNSPAMKVYVTEKNNPNALITSCDIPDSFDGTMLIPFDVETDFSLYVRRYAT